MLSLVRCVSSHLLWVLCFVFNDSYGDWRKCMMHYISCKLYKQKHQRNNINHEVLGIMLPVTKVAVINVLI